MRSYRGARFSTSSFDEPGCLAGDVCPVTVLHPCDLLLVWRPAQRHLADAGHNAFCRVLQVDFGEIPMTRSPLRFIARCTCRDDR